MATKNENVYTVDEAAAVLGLNRNTVYRACSKDQLPAVRIGRLFRLPKNAIDALAGKEQERPAAKSKQSGKEPFQVFRGKSTVLIRFRDASVELNYDDANSLAGALTSNRPSSVVGRRLSEEEKNEVLSLYKDNIQPLAAIGARFGVSRQAIQQLVTKAGISGTRRPEQAARILRLHAEGRMGPKIAS